MNFTRKTHRVLLLVVAIYSSMVFTNPEQAYGQLDLDITFDYSFGAPLDPHLIDDFEAAFLRGANRWSSFVDNDIPVVLVVRTLSLPAGPNPGDTVLGGAVISASNVGYTDYRNSIIALNTGTPDFDLVSALPNTLSGLNADVPAGASVHPFSMRAANSVLRALGLARIVQVVEIRMNSLLINDGVGIIDEALAVNYDMDRSDGIGANSFDVETIAIHEIGHVLGFTSSATNVAASIRPQPLDLYSFMPGSDPETLAEFTTAPRNLIAGTDRIFDDLMNEIPMTDGHWLNDGGPESPNGVMDPVLFRGAINFVSLNDLRVFGLIGWDVAEITLGDVNLDGQLNLLDIAPFVDLLSSGVYEDEVFIRADINRDGAFNLLDVAPFVDLFGN